MSNIVNRINILQFSFTCDIFSFYKQNKQKSIVIKAKNAWHRLGFVFVFKTNKCIFVFSTQTPKQLIPNQITNKTQTFK